MKFSINLITRDGTQHVPIGGEDIASVAELRETVAARVALCKSNTGDKAISRFVVVATGSDRLVIVVQLDEQGHPLTPGDRSLFQALYAYERESK